MTTRRFALDKNNHKIFIGSPVKYQNKTFLIEEIEYLSWNSKQYLTLTDKRNKNKKIKFILSDEVKAVNIR